MNNYLWFPLLFIMPGMIQLGVNRGSPFFPRVLTRKPKVDRLLKIGGVAVVFVNGGILCVAHALRMANGDQSNWVLPIYLGLPFFAYQLWFATVAVYKNTLEMGQRAKRESARKRRAP